MDEEQTAISVKLPASLRAKLKAAAEAEDRSEASFVRYHIGRMLGEFIEVDRDPDGAAAYASGRLQAKGSEA